jgi:GDP-L-fucose synthase
LNLKDKKVLVFGGSSMIGRQVIHQLLGKGAEVIAPSHQDCDLLYYDHIKHYFDYYGTGKHFNLINLSGFSGNLNRNQLLAFDTFWANTQILANLYRLAKDYEAAKVLSVVPSCSYPDKPILYENEYFDGSPHITIESHSLARRNALGFSRQLYKQYKIPSVVCCLNNCAGPFDSVDLDKTKAVMGMIAKFVKAKRENTDVVLWGDGSVFREITFSQDAASGIICCFEEYENYVDLINIGPGTEISIKDLAHLIASIVEFPCDKIKWDTSKPNGQKRKVLSAQRCQAELSYRPRYTLEEGLRETINWYTDNY